MVGFSLGTGATLADGCVTRVTEMRRLRDKNVGNFVSPDGVEPAARHQSRML